MSKELIRVAILWHEMWHEALEEASRLYFGEHNIEGMLAVLEPLHAMLDEGPSTIKEKSFLQVFILSFFYQLRCWLFLKCHLHSLNSRRFLFCIFVLPCRPTERVVKLYDTPFTTLVFSITKFKLWYTFYNIGFWHHKI